MSATGSRPSKRTDYPSVAEFVRYLDGILNKPRTDLKLEDNQKWPLFPVAETPWPLLMPLSKGWPLDEAKSIFEKYRGEHGSRRLHLYGPYQNGLATVRPGLHDSAWTREV